MITNEKIVESFFLSNKLSQIQIDSYNHLINVTIPNIINNSHLVVSIPHSNKSIVFKFVGVYMEKPFTLDDQRNQCVIYPIEARHRDLSYETLVYTDIEITYIDSSSNQILSSNVISRHLLFKLPVMVKSELCNLHHSYDLHDECEYDHGGYFIIKGKERVLIAQERINYNQIYVFKKKKSKYLYLAEIRSIKPDGDYSLLIQVKLNASENLYFQLPYINKDIPFGIVFKAMDIDIDLIRTLFKQDRQVWKIVYNNLELYQNMPQKDAIDYLSEYLTVTKLDSSKRYNYVKQLLEEHLIPHIGILSTSVEKAKFLLLMTQKLLHTYFGHREEDERDNISNKRVEMSGILIGNLLQGLFKRYLKTIQQHIEKRGDVNITSCLTKFNIHQRLYQCFTTGNWGMPKSTYIRQGVSQILSRLTYNSTLSHIRRIIIPIGKESKNAQIRQLHPSSYGFTCAVETPEGQTSGIIKNFALSATVSNNICGTFVHELILELLSDLLHPDLCQTKILLNGVWICNTNQHQEFTERFRKYRIDRFIPHSVSISYTETENEINIFSDAGRLLRPVIQLPLNKHQFDTIVSQTPVQQLWQTCVEQGIVVYIDTKEAESSVIAMNLDEQIPSATFCEIHPLMMLGICAGLIPFSNHSQAPRNIYQASMGKQAIGMYTSNYQKRFDTVGHVLHYPQKPLVSTKIASYANVSDIPSGINLVVAVACYTGYNQEDSVILNKSAIDRGLFHSVELKCVTANETRKGTHSSETIGVPQPEIQRKSYNYSKLDSDGIVAVGTEVEENDVLVGMIYYNDEVPTKDCSIACKISEKGRVDSVIVTTNSHGYKHVKIRLRYIRIPEIGDKFASCAAQKGTCLKTGATLSRPCGTSVAIEDIRVGEYVWGWNGTGVQQGRCVHKQYMGEKTTLKVTTANGRSIECTPDHRFLTLDGWKEASELTSSDSIIANLPAPLDVHGKDEHGWSLKMSYANTKGNYEWILNMDTDRNKCLIFARVLGYLLTDGWLCKYNGRQNKYRCGVSFGTLLAANMFITDFNILIEDMNITCNKKPRFYTSNSFAGACWVLSLPDQIAHFLASLEGIQIGKRILCKPSFPTFIHSAPLSIQREFVGGIFGGDGCAPYLIRRPNSNDELACVNIMWKCLETNQVDMIKHLETLQNMLGNLGVTSSLSSPKYIRSKALDGNKRMCIGLNLCRNSEFLDHVGFRYDMNKQVKLASACTYWQMRKYMKLSHDMSTRDVPTPIEWLKQIRAHSFFEKGSHCIDRYATSIPYYCLPVSNVETSTIEQVWDITVEDLHSFIADGLMVHNCGMVYRQEDMPFNHEGITPDLIINAHAIPSRMTINMLMEMILGKAGSLSGELHDATAFEHSGEEIMQLVEKPLLENGFETQGNELLYNGMTGEPFQAKVFMGVCFYQRLKHLVSAKIHTRSSAGDVQSLSRQPVAGRSRDGGNRLPQWNVIILLVCNVACNIIKLRESLYYSYS
jgi:DNA-directed RNA polymerase II subunit RPB2